MISKKTFCEASKVLQQFLSSCDGLSLIIFILNLDVRGDRCLYLLLSQQLNSSASAVYSCQLQNKRVYKFHPGCFRQSSKSGKYLIFCDEIHIIFRSDLRGGPSKQTIKFIETAQFSHRSGTAFFGKVQVRGLFQTRMLISDLFTATLLRKKYTFDKIIFISNN